MPDGATSPVADLIARSGDPFSICCERYVNAPNGFWREILGIEPDPWQEKANRALAHGHKRLSLRSGHGVGKMLAMSNIVPTPDGDRRWGDLQPGDRLFGRDGEATHIVARHDWGVLPIYRVTFDDGTFCRVGAEHLWTVRGRAQRRVDRVGGKNGEFITLTTAEMMRRGVKRPNGAMQARQWEIPHHGPAQYPARDIAVPPYLLGAILGDGSIGDTGVRIYGGREKVAVWASRCDAADISYAMQEFKGGDRWSIGLHQQMPLMRDLGLAGIVGVNKFVPQDYRENTAAVRLAVLQGLLDSDGYCMPHSTAIFTSVSSRLAEDVAWLVRSLGGKAFLGAAKPSHYTKDGERIQTQDHYDVTVRLPRGMDPFTLPSKAARLRPDFQDRYLTRWIDSIEPDGEEDAMCVMVDAPDGLYLADDFIVTHNSTFAAGAICWFANTRAPMKIGVTAPSAPQLFDALWAETRTMFKRLPPVWQDLWDIDADKIKLKMAPDESFITARTARADKPEALQGLHARHVMLVVDEASGVDEAVFNAAGGAMSTAGAVSILTGNPTRSTGFFWRTHNLERDRWFCMRIPSTESRRVSADFVQELADRWGEDSNEYRIRVLGEFPLAEADALIPADLIESAMRRAIEIDFGEPECWGLDVARFGSDQSVLIKRRGNSVIEPPRRWQGIDTMQLAGVIKAEYDMTPAGSRPALICVDVIGIGSGVVDRLTEQQLPILGVNVGETPSVASRFGRLRDEIWVRIREWLESRRVSLPFDDKLRADLAAPRVTHLSDGRMQIESKSQLKSRGFASPDSGDALALTFCPMGMALQMGMGNVLNSKIPVRASIKGME